MRYEIKHRFDGRVLFSGEFGSLRLCAGAAVSVRSNLRGADLGGAYLRGAYLGGADLGDADLGGADLIDAGQDSRGYRFVAWRHKGDVMVMAGCRYFMRAEAREHWTAAHQDNPDLHAECLAKIDQIETVATARGWLTDPTPEAAEHAVATAESQMEDR